MCQTQAADRAATRGWLMAPLPLPIVATVLVAAAAFAPLLDPLKRLIFALAKPG